MRLRRRAVPSLDVPGRPGSTTPRRRPWHRTRRLLAALGIAILVLAVVMVSESWVRAEGVVVGELTAVNPISQVRIKSVPVVCLQQVSAGHLLAQVENELTVETVQQELEQLNFELEQARSTVEVAANQAEAANRLFDARIAVRDQLKAVLDAQSKLVNDHYIASLAWQKAKGDVVRAGAEAEAARFVYETKLEDRRRAGIRAALIEQRIASLRRSPDLMGSYEVRAPKAGFLTQCDARVGEVVDASTALFRIFNPDDAFAVVFLDPSDAARRAVGDQLSMTIDGMEGTIAGTIDGFYPQFSGLPESLTRYFWQQEKWSQFAPVRIALPELNPQRRRHLRASARVQVSTWEIPRRGFAGAVARLLNIEQWSKSFCPVIAQINLHALTGGTPIDAACPPSDRG